MGPLILDRCHAQVQFGLHSAQHIGPSAPLEAPDRMLLEGKKLPAIEILEQRAASS